MDLSALQSAVSDLKTEVDKIAPTTSSAGSDDQAAVDALTSEVESLVAELSGTSTSATPPLLTSTEPASPSPDAPATSAPAGVGAWTPPGS